MRARRKSEALAPAAEERIDGARIGVVVSASPPRVDFEGSRGPAEARVAAGIDDDALAGAARERQEAVLLFDGGDPRRPVILSLLRSSTPHLDAVLAGPLPAAEKVARLDGKRVVLDGRDEVVLTCGRSSLTLRRDGKIVLRGVNVVSEAAEVQKIRGGKIQIN